MATKKNTNTAAASTKATSSGARKAQTVLRQKASVSEERTTTTAERMQIGKELLCLISSATSTATDAPRNAEERADPNNSPFLIAASQVNSDLALAAQCELEGDIAVDDLDSGVFDFMRSPMYWRLRDTFLEDAAKGDTYALLTLVWRAYNAGLLSPDRLVPDTAQTRRERRSREEPA